MSETIKLPDFLPSDTTIYDSGETHNQYTGEGIELTSLERTIYHAIIKAESTAHKLDAKYVKTLNPDDANPDAVKYWEIVRKGTDWFKSNNAKAYMVLID